MKRHRSAHRGGRAWMACACVALVSFASTGGLAAAHGRSAKPVTAAQIASGSISGVVTLHDLALTIKPGSKAPKASNAFKHLATGFATEIQETVVVGAPAASLAHTLRVYRQLASELAASAGKANAKLPSSFTATIKANDRKWKAALTAIGKAAHLNLLKSVPKLLYASGATT